MNKISFTNQERYFFKAIPALVWQFVFLGIPFVLLLILSFVKNIHAPWTFDNLTLEHYAQLFHSEFIRIILRSFCIALTTALFCLLVGYPLTYFIALRNRQWKNIFLFFLVLPFVTNLLVLTYAWTFVLDKDGLLNQILMKIGFISEPLLMLNSYFAIMLVMFYCYLPFMIMPLFTSLEKFDLTLIEASRDLGANQWQTFFKVIFPLTLPAIQTGILLVFVPAFGEFVIPLLMGGDKYMFVGTLISHFFLIGQDESLGAAFTVLSSFLLFCSVLLFIAFFSSKKISRQRNYDGEIS